MNWDDFHDRDYRVLYALDTEMVVELQKYVQENGTFTPGSAPEFLKQKWLEREEAINSLSEIDSEIIAFCLKPPPLSYSAELRKARREGEGRLWNMPPQ